MTAFITEALTDARSTLEKFISEEENVSKISHAIDLMVQTYKVEGRIISCGNGGSMCDSMHFAEELTGRFRKERAPLAAASISDPSHLTCVSNDYGYSEVFSRWVDAWGKKGDCLLAISTSGNSENVIKAVQKAKDKNMNVIALLGKGGGKLKNMADVSLIVDHSISDRIQEIHIKLIHIFIEGIERKIFPENY